MIIYKISNSINNKLYIGKTSKTIEKRFSEHCKTKIKTKSVIKSAINKYGSENFKIEVVEICEQNISNDREKYYIKFFDSIKNGYNLTEGGDGASFGDLNVSKRPDVREKLKYCCFYGKKHSDETKKKISEKLKGHKLSNETKNKISNNVKGHKASKGNDSKLSKKYIIINPNNQVLIINGMREFCRNNNLNPRSMRYIKDVNKKYKDYMCYTYNENKYSELTSKIMN